MENKIYTLITGASEGLGKCFALECAGIGKHLILVALPESGLLQLADYIYRNFPVMVHCFETDLTIDNNCRMLYNEIKANGFVINTLINNAGIGNTATFEEGSIELYEQQVKLNVLATTLVTRLFIQDLKKNSPAYILNVGSLASFCLPPKKPVYAATKAFVLSFTLSLRNELKKEGITICALCPGGLNTSIINTLMNQTGSWLSRASILNPETVASIGIKGLLKGKTIIVPGVLNQITLLCSQLLPAFIKNIISAHIMKKMQAPQLFNPQLIYTPTKNIDNILN